MKRRAIAQLKGGVGKSTTTLFLAEHWAIRGKRILVIDLDPQASISLMLLSRRGLARAEEEHRTLPQLIGDDRNGIRPVESYIVSRGSDLIELHGSRAGYVSLLPSVPKLWFRHFDFDRECYRRSFDPVDELHRILGSFLYAVDRHYDCVLFDCPPGFNSLTRAAIRLSEDGLFAPTIADQVSMQSLKDFVEIGLRDTMKFPWEERMYVVVSKYSGTNQQKENLDVLRKQYQFVTPPVPMRDQVQIATEHLDGARRPYTTKYGPRLIRPLGKAVEQMTNVLFDVTFT